MHNDEGHQSDGDDDGASNPRLPAIIPSSFPPTVAPIWRFVQLMLPRWRVLMVRLLRHWRMIGVAALASGAGVLGAALWPYHNKLRDVVIVSLAGPNDASRIGDGARSHASFTTRLNRPLAMIASESCHRHVPTPRLVVSAPTSVLHANQPASLGVRVYGAPDGAELVICGFAAKTIISAGRSVDDKTWMLPAIDVADAVVIPPPGYVGLMKLGVVLVNADRTIADRRTLFLQWQPATAPPGVMSSPESKDIAETEIDRQLDEGRRLQAAGNLPLARGIFLRYAQAGYARAAFLYADSYDPISLAKRQLLPPDSDPALARIWYRKALDWGSREASARLERLANW